MADSYAQKKVGRITKTFEPPRDGYRNQACHIADTVDKARLYRLGYCQDGRELRADYYEYVYDTSFARRRRRNRY
jgi:hypothetical protein